MRESNVAAAAPRTPLQQFDFSAFLSGALKLECEMDYLLSNPSSLPTTSPLLLSSSSLSPPRGAQQGRKRRRGEVSNPANTLDGLVARRADDAVEPLGKRFLSEQDAIESPCEESEMRRMETDPDVSTRTCSICGYEGKWASEMIRHKRVHTNDRPFKCRYCSRTSKWKADLIRHVAKTHGIRVVSKYSRSKTFDNSKLAGREEEDKPTPLDCESALSALSRPRPRAPVSYRCVQCLVEKEQLSVVVDHLRSAHSLSPYECGCGLAFENLGDALGHGNRCQHTLVIHVTPIYSNAHARQTSPDSGLQVDVEDDSEAAGSSSSSSSFSSADHEQPSPPADLPKPLPCTVSPLVARSAEGLIPPLTPSFPFDLSTLLALQTQSPYFAALNPFLSAFTPVAPRPSACCDRCDARFAEPAALARHEAFHGSDRRHRCPLCDYAVATPVNIVRHMQFHHAVGAEQRESLPEEEEEEEEKEKEQKTEQEEELEVCM